MNKVFLFRNIVRILTLLTIPWLGDLTELAFGEEIEVEVEVELVVFLSFFVLGTFWCGWFCPFGNVSYVIEKIGGFIERMIQKPFPKFKLQYSFPDKLDKPLRYLKYLTLIAFIVVIYGHHENYFFTDHGDMYRSSAFSSNFLHMKMYAVLLVPFFIPRFFCKYLCFQKGAYNIVNKIFRFAKIERDTEACIDCNRCKKTCEMNIDIASKKTICGDDCISCFNCLDENTCPKDINALKFTWFNRVISVMKFSIIALVTYTIVTAVMMQIFPDGEDDDDDEMEEQTTSIVIQSTIRG